MAACSVHNTLAMGGLSWERSAQTNPHITKHEDPWCFLRIPHNSCLPGTEPLSRYSWWAWRRSGCWLVPRSKEGIPGRSLPCERCGMAGGVH